MRDLLVGVDIVAIGVFIWFGLGFYEDWLKWIKKEQKRVER